MRYGGAFVSIAVATGVRLLPDPVPGIQFPFATAFIAILVTGYYGGFWPALTALILGALAADFFLLPPQWSFGLSSPDQEFGMVLYLLTGLAIALLAGSMHSTQRALCAANHVLEIRIGERTKELAAANQELRASDERNRLLVQGVSSHAIFMLDTSGQVTTWNPGTARIYGYKVEEIVGQHLSRFYTSEDNASGRPQQELQIAIEKGCYEEEGRRVRKDGSRFLATVTITPMHNDAAQLVGFVKVTRDITKRKELANALEEAARFNRATLNGLSSQIAILDEIGTIIAVNQTWDSFAASNGYVSEQTWIGTNYLTVCDRSAELGSADRAIVAAGIRRVLSRSIPQFACEYPWHTPTENYWFAVRVTPFPGEGPQRVIVAHEDITELKLATEGLRRALTEHTRRQHENITELKLVTEGLRASEERLRVMIEGVSAHAIFMLDAGGDILTRNREAEQIDGYTADEIIGKHYSCLFPPERVADGLPMQELELAIAAGRMNVEGWRIRKNGSRFWTSGTLAALYDEDHIVKGFSMITRDLTAQRRNDELLRSVLGHTLDAIVIIDERGTVAMINLAGEKMFGRAAAEVIGENFNLLLPEPYHSEYDGYLANYLPTRKPRIVGLNREVQGLRKDGSTFPMELTVTEFQLDGQRHFVGIVRDITEKKKLEAQLHQSQKMEAFGQLAGGVAHDFNNLLTVIFGYSELLLMALPPEDANRNMVSEIHRASQRAASLTRQLLAFSRQQVLEPRVLDLNAVIKDTATMLRRLIGEDIHFTTVLRPNISSVKVDPGQIEQVILNLAVNARDAMPQGGKLTLETSDIELDESYTKVHAEVQPGRFVLLAISDTGCGMTPEVKARVFEPFFTTKGVGKGTGLGLAVVHGIVEQSNGSIDLDSEVGVGTTFKIYLPTVEERQTNILDPGLARSSGGSETILLVEDEDGVREFAARSLQELGYTVLKASGGSAAVELMVSRREKIDLLVTDVVMPELNGRQLAEILLKSIPELKIIFVSGYTDDSIVRHGVLQANVAFLQKPFTPNSLACKVREVLDQQ